MQRLISNRGELRSKARQAERGAGRPGANGRAALVEKARRRVAEGYYDQTWILDIAVERLVSALVGRPTRNRPSPGRKEESRRARRPR